MNFNSHKQKLIDSIKITLGKPKGEIIQGFKPILSSAKDLFNSNQYDFWLVQLGTIPIDEIPMTFYGLESAQRSLGRLENYTRNELESAISNICEQLFTYSNEEDMCDFQSDNHYYYYMPGKRVFKESTLGMTNLNVQNVNRDDIRIAKVSELAFNPERFY